MTSELLPPELLGDAPWNDHELDAIVEAGDVPAVQPLRDRELATSEQAAWALAEVARLAEAQADVARQADAWRDRISEWEQSQSRPLAGRSAFLSGRLERYALAVRERFGDKTLRLPSGDVKTTAHSASVVIDGDEKLLAAWLHPRLSDAEWEKVANVSVSLRISELRKLVVVATDEDGNTEVRIGGYEGDAVPEVSVVSASVTAKVHPSPLDHVLDR